MIMPEKREPKNSQQGRTPAESPRSAYHRRMDKLRLLASLVAPHLPTLDDLLHFTSALSYLQPQPDYQAAWSSQLRNTPRSLSTLWQGGGGLGLPALPRDAWQASLQRVLALEANDGGEVDLGQGDEDCRAKLRIEAGLRGMFEEPALSLLKCRAAAYWGSSTSVTSEFELNTITGRSEVDVEPGMVYLIEQWRELVNEVLARLGSRLLCVETGRTRTTPRVRAKQLHYALKRAGISDDRAHVDLVDRFLVDDLDVTSCVTTFVTDGRSTLSATTDKIVAAKWLWDHTDLADSLERLCNRVKSTFPFGFSDCEESVAQYRKFRMEVLQKHVETSGEAALPVVWRESLAVYVRERQDETKKSQARDALLRRLENFVLTGRDAELSVEVGGLDDNDVKALRGKASQLKLQVSSSGKGGQRVLLFRIRDRANMPTSVKKKADGT